MNLALVLQILAVLVLGLMCGSELNVATITNPILNRQPVEIHVPLRAGSAVLLGRVMPFWMVGSIVLNLLLLIPNIGLVTVAWRLAAAALGIQIAAAIFSLVAPVPINNRIAKWDAGSLPGDWRAQERRWDIYHCCRTAALIVAFALLCSSLAAR